MLETRPGLCIRCDARGIAGTPCETRSCKKTRTHLLPEEYAARAHEPAFLSDPMMGRVLDDWLVVDLLGRGGFGQVYLVLQLPILLKAALKLLHRDPPSPEETPAQALARRAAATQFTGEAQALATLTHPGIVRLLKFGHFEGAPYLVMEFAPGRVLANAMEGDPSTNEVYRPDNAQHILRQLVNALEAAHAHGIVHRDIKPANMVLQNLPGDPYFLRVLDFGIAKFLSEGSKTSLSAGTPIYMAPEQFDRAKIGPWSDLYAVGVMTYELIFGQAPFSAPTVERVLARKLAPDADPLRDIRGHVSPAIESFFARALARRPEDRYASTSEMRVGLESLFTAVRAVPRESLLAFGRMVDGEGLGPIGGPRTSGFELARTDLDPRLPPPAHRRVRAWGLGLAAVAAAGVGVAVATTAFGPAAVAPSDALVAVAAAPDAGAVVDTAESPPAPDTVLAAAPEVTAPQVAAAADTLAPDVVDSPPDSAPAPEPDTAVMAVAPDVSPLEDSVPALEDTTPELDTRRGHATTRARPDATIVDTAPSAPPPTTAPMNAPDTRETRPYSFLD
ncbi:MAG: protein kinase [Myxococcota bacterium]